MTIPYITPEILTSAPTGIAWSTIPRVQSTPAEQLAEQTNICWRATHEVDAICSQPLRATIDTEELEGPDVRLTLRANGVARVTTSRWPISQILGASVCSSSVFPPTWNIIDPTKMRTDMSIVGQAQVTLGGAAASGPSAIDIAPGYISWLNGRNGFRLRIQYVNGWPHAGLTTLASAGDMSVEVDDITGFYSEYLQIYDGSATEIVSVESASGSIGAGTVTLTAPLAYDHEPGVVISALPLTVQQATILLAVADTLTRGGQAITAQSLPGSAAGGGGSLGANDLRASALKMLGPYRRII